MNSSFDGLFPDTWTLEVDTINALVQTHKVIANQAVQNCLWDRGLWCTGAGDGYVPDPTKTS